MFVFVCECFRCLMRLCGLIVVYCAMLYAFVILPFCIVCCCVCGVGVRACSFKVCLCVLSVVCDVMFVRFVFVLVL